jgi:phosphoribosylformylglycinamidine synthase subunit PurS
LIARVVVTPKPVVNDPQGVTVRQALSSLGFEEVQDVRVGKYIEVSLEADSEEAAGERVEQMCRKLLANQVIEDYRYTMHGENLGPPPGPPSSDKARGRQADGAGDPPLPSDDSSSHEKRVVP